MSLKIRWIWPFVILSSLVVTGCGPVENDVSLVDQEQQVRNKTSMNLKRAEEPRDIERLIKNLEDEDSDVREAASSALINLGWSPQTQEERIWYLIANLRWDELADVGQPAVGPIVKVLGDKKSYIRSYAAKTLNRLNWKPQTEQERVLYLIAEKKWDTLVRIGQPAVEPLVRALGDKSWRANRLAHRDIIDTLGRIGDETAVEPLIKYLHDKRSPQPDEAAKALGQIGDRRAVEPLIRALKRAQKRGDHFLLSDTVQALGKIGDPRAVESLIEVLQDKDARLARAAAARSLGEIGDPRAVEPLREALSFKNRGLCQAAVEALDKLGQKPETQQEELTHLIATKNYEELIKVGQPAIDQLIDILALHDVSARLLAVEVLGEIGEPNAIEPLIWALKDKNSYVCAAAAKAIRKNPDKRAIEPLKRLLSDWHAGPDAAFALKILGWEPTTDEQKIIFLVASRDKEGLLKNWEYTKTVLFANIGSGDSKKVKNAICALISIGKDEILGELIRILNTDTRRQKEIAEIFLSSGNDTLAAAARAWAKRKGYEVLSYINTSPSATWGQM